MSASPLSIDLAQAVAHVKSEFGVPDFDVMGSERFH